MPTGRLHEQNFNTLLAEVLRETNARWREDDDIVRPERVRDGKRIDIEIADPRLRPVAIELAYGGDRDEDAKKRLGGDIDTAIAVAIPQEFKAMSEGAARKSLSAGVPPLRYAVVQEDYRFPVKGYIEGTARDLAAIIPVAAVTRERLAELADKVAGHIDKARTTLERVIPHDLAKRLVDDVYQRSTLTGFRTMLVLWLDAMLVQDHLNSAGQPVTALPLADEVRPSALVGAWRKIMKTNWRSIFEPAVAALRDTTRQSRNGTAKALRELLHAVEAIEVARLGDHINIAAELFPKLSEDRKNAAAFYTTPATAELVSAMLIQDRRRDDWSDPVVFERLRIADLACGTGSLLRAAFHRVRALHEAHGGTMESAGAMHRGAMEEGLTGCDVSAIAAHLTNSSLAMMGGGQPYGNTQIGWVDVGKPKSNGLSTGSLEFLEANEINDMFADMGGATSGTANESMPIRVEDGSLDYAIMNPPYSRTRGTGDNEHEDVHATFAISGLTDEQRDECQKRWGRLLRNHDAKKTAGMAASFICLAESKLKQGGRMGFVLPLSAASVDAWVPTRRMIQVRFDDVTVVAKAGGNAGADAWSADTGMGEMLLFATKRRTPHHDDTVERPVASATVTRTPTRQGEAGEFARAILAAERKLRAGRNGVPIKIGADDLGLLAKCSVRPGAPWFGVAALSAELIVSAQALLDGALRDERGQMPLGVAMTTLDDLFEVGPTHHLIGHVEGFSPIGAYEFHELARPSDARSGICSMWHTRSKEQTSLVTLPTHKGVECDAELATRMKRTRGTLHYSRSMRWTSQALMAATTEQPTLGGNAWATLQHTDDRVCKAFALWGNSIFGLLTHWTQAARQHKGRGSMQIGGIKAVPVPRLDTLPEERLRAAAEAFDLLKGETLMPVCQGHADPKREAVDIAALAMFAMPASRALKAAATLRDLWCAEPSVHGDNRQAVKLLRDRGLV